MKRNVEIDDTLQERVDGACSEVQDYLLEYLAENPDLDTSPCIWNALDYAGSIHEIVDGSVPIYNSEIDDTWYLYASELKEAYENEGIGDNSRERSGMVAIYCYIRQEVGEWWEREASGIFDRWQESLADSEAN